MNKTMTRNIALLGSTGSIGCNTLDVIAQNKDKFRLVSIAAGNNIELLVKQITDFQPEIISVKNRESADALRNRFPNKKILYGPEGLMEAVGHPDVDTMVSAIDGTTALEATLLAISRNQRLCLANKETLVAAGELINARLDASQAEVVPIDSEQSAIFQSLGGNDPAFIRKVILTASGGPFFTRNRQQLADITIAEALAHPTWSMGTKITIDSATLMNKALEVVEAFYLFRLRNDQVDVVIHPQSIVHSMVEFIDSSVIAQLSVPDMRMPILYSLSYPHRVPFVSEPLDFGKLRKLDFFPVDAETFTSIQMAYHVLKEGKNAGAVLNAANEVAVDYFLREKIAFIDIFKVVEHIFYNETFYELNSLEDVTATIGQTKAKTASHIDGIMKN